MRVIGLDSFPSDAPCFQSRPALGPVQQNTGSFKEIGPQQPITPLGDAAIVVLIPRLLPSRR